MMRHLSIFLLIFTFGCTGMVSAPETPRERLVAAEASVQAVAGTLGQMAESGTLKGQDATRAKATLDAAHSALRAWRLAPDSRDQMALTLAALQAAQAIVNQLGRPA